MARTCKTFLNLTADRVDRLRPKTLHPERHADGRCAGAPLQCCQCSSALTRYGTESSKNPLPAVLETVCHLHMNRCGCAKQYSAGQKPTYRSGQYSFNI